MATLETAGGPLQPPWPPPPPSIPEESCHPPPLSNFTTIPNPHHNVFDGNRHSTAIYVAQHAPTIDSATVNVMPTMGYTSFFLHPTLPTARILRLSSHGLVHSSRRYHNVQLFTHTRRKPSASTATSALAETTATTTHYISFPYNKKSTEKESLSSTIFTTATHLSPIPEILPPPLPRSRVVRVIRTHEPSVTELMRRTLSHRTTTTGHHRTNIHQSPATLDTGHSFQDAAHRRFQGSHQHTTATNSLQAHQTTTANSNQPVADHTGGSTPFAGTPPKSNRRIVHVRQANLFHHGKIISPLRGERPAMPSTTDHHNCNTACTPCPTTATPSCRQQTGIPQLGSTMTPSYHCVDDKPSAQLTVTKSSDRTGLTDDELAKVHPNLPISTTAVSRAPSTAIFHERSSHAKTYRTFIHSTTTLTARESSLWHHRIRVSSNNRQNSLLSLAVWPNKLPTRHTYSGGKEIPSPPVSTTTSRTRMTLRMTNYAHRSPHDNDYTAILTGIPWYRPAQRIFCMTPNLKPGHPPWPPPHVPLLLPPHTNSPKPLQYYSYDSRPKYRLLQYAAYQVCTHLFPPTSSHTADKNLLRPP